ncbi:MAG: hypothetical protein ABI725_08180 [Chloroflexota bacterium]
MRSCSSVFAAPRARDAGWYQPKSANASRACYWPFGEPDDTRLSITPDIATPVTASDYFAGRDPVLEAVQAE